MPTSPLVPVIVGGAIAIIGSVAVTCLTLRNQTRQQRVARRADFLEKQLGHFYGPVNFLLSENRLMFKHSQNVMAISEEVLSKRPPSLEAQVQEVRTKEIHDTIDVSNEYTARAIENNRAIHQRISEHFSYVEPDDAKAISKFGLDFVRSSVEFARIIEGRARLPFDVQAKLETPIFFDPDFADQIQRRFDEKLADLKKLREAQRRRWFLPQRF